MSHSLLYQAIPTRSRLYARLQEDKVFVALLTYLFPYGCGTFRFFDIDPEEREEILEGMFESHWGIIGSAEEARRRVAEYQAELERTLTAFPGVECRRASLENCSQDVRERLTRELGLMRGDASEFANKLLFGDGPLAPHLDLALPGWDKLEVVSVPVVREGAAVLRRIEPAVLFPEDWHRENFDHWRRLFLEADGKSEVLVVGIA